MFGLDRAWWIIPLILVIVLIVWGPGKMPEVGAGLGHAIREFRHGVSGMRESVVDAVSMPQEPASPPNQVPRPDPSASQPPRVPNPDGDGRH